MFSKLLILDFEATCENNDSSWPNEIIEFPVILFDTQSLEIEAEFHQYVRPTINPTLTQFCKGLTGITQEQVDHGVLLADCLEVCSVLDICLPKKKSQCHEMSTDIVIHSDAQMLVD